MKKKCYEQMPDLCSAQILDSLSPLVFLHFSFFK
jgi:hypothetical protein